MHDQAVSPQARVYEHYRWKDDHKARSRNPVQWGVNAGPEDMSTCNALVPRPLGWVATRWRLGGIDLITFSFY